MSDEAIRKRIAVEQVEALFGAVTVSVIGGAVAATVLALALRQLGAADGRTSVVWVSCIVACAVAHILLCRAYRRSWPVGDDWPKWANWFTAISFAEGLGWGWAPLGLTSAGHSDVQHLVFLIVGGICAATVPGFSPYLPAFAAIFLPATSGALIASLTSDDPIQRAAFPLMLVFIGAVGPLGLKANRSLKQLVGLRIQTEYLADDLRKQKEIAEQANVAKSTFLAAASHDLRQPVHALGLFVGALRNVAMPREGEQILDQVESSIDALDGLFTALLDISRLDAGVVEVERRPFAIGSLLERVRLDHLDEARAKGLSIATMRTAAVVDSDPLLVERILRNLVANAVRYTDRGRIVVGCRRRGATVALQVWDTGRGIAPDEQGRVFQEYYQIGNPERDRAKGLGLGLAIVRRLVDLLGTTLSLRSRLGRGSCFEIALPRAAALPDVDEPGPTEAHGAFVHALIVVVDDELAIREAMARLLTGWGHEVVTAGSGDEAVRRLASCPTRPGLLVCDYRLRDGETGIAVIERLRADYNEAIPAMLITGDTAPDRLADAQASGLLLLHKPVANSRLRAAIVNLIAAAKVEDLASAEAPTAG